MAGRTRRRVDVFTHDVTRSGLHAHCTAPQHADCLLREL